MDEKTLRTLEYAKILEKLAAYAAFAVTADLARSMRPTNDIDEANRRQAETEEAVNLLAARPEFTIGGCRDIREALERARRGAVLETGELLDVKYSLVAARNLSRSLERVADQYPNIYEIVVRMPAPSGIIEAVTRSISERGDILDSASQRLANIRHDLRITYERLLSKLQKIVGDPRTSPLLQEALITQRDGRYVIPLRAEFKGRIQAIVHDQSASGATLFVEPLAVVDLNNEYRELLLEERDEERRILAALSQQVGQQADEIALAIELVGQIDLILARARYAEDLRAFRPKFHALPKKPRSAGHPGSVVKLRQARHPLLDSKTVVPVDVELDGETYALVITGPNTGGKTVTLKTVGLLVLMAQSGMHIPVDSGSEISVFNTVFADIGDEQSIEQSLSTFSSHITNIIRILDEADHRSLVVLDELGAGTDPQEGAALARALLRHLLDRSITTLVTTHHPELKSFAHATPGVVNASVEFDLQTLRPTFRLTIGLPGRSNALAIADQLGLPREIIQDARSDLSPTDIRADDLLDEIHRQRDTAQIARRDAEQVKQDAQKIRSELAMRMERIEDERREILEEARRESREEVEAVQEEIRQLRRALSLARQPLEALEAVEEQVESLEETVERVVERREPDIPQQLVERRPVRLGDRVRLRTLDQKGVVTSLSEEEAEVQLGMLRVRARLSELEVLAPSQDAPLEKKRTAGPRPAPRRFELAESPGVELDLRGQRAEDALEALERYLERAYLAGLPFARIIHGKGTGRLRQVVREALQGNPHVRSFEPGREQEGGEGVTVAKLDPPT